MLLSVTVPTLTRALVPVPPLILAVPVFFNVPALLQLLVVSKTALFVNVLLLAIFTVPCVMFFAVENDSLIFD